LGPGSVARKVTGRLVGIGARQVRASSPIKHPAIREMAYGMVRVVERCASCRRAFDAQAPVICVLGLPVPRRVSAITSHIITSSGQIDLCGTPWKEEKQINGS
jgi:hypothetical protein